MSDYVVFFATIALLGIFYTMYYKKYVFAPKMQKLNTANQFRYARNLNAELISLLWLNASLFENTGLAFNGLTFEDTLDNLQNLRDKVYTTATFKQLVGKQKTKRSHIETLHANIADQIKMQQEIKASFNKLITRHNRIAA